MYVDSLYIFYPLGEKISPMEFELVQQGTEGRGQIHFGLPEELDEEGVYLIFRYGSYGERLINAGFSEKKSGMYQVFYKE